MNDAQLIDRLRATYTAVAEQTPVDDTAPIDAYVRVVPLGERSRRHRFLGAAAAAVMVLVVVTVMVDRDDRPAVGSIEALAGRLRHAGLGLIPEGFGLVSIETTEDRDELVFTDGSRELRIVTERRVGPVLGDVPVRGRLGAISSEGDRAELRWTEREGVAISLVGTDGWTEDELVGIADTVVTVSDEAWELLVRRSGFAELPMNEVDRAVYDDSFPAIDGQDGGGVLTRSTAGSLQGGLRIMTGCCEGGPPVPDRSVFFREPGVYKVNTGADIDRVEIVLDDQVIATVRPIADPAAPSEQFASVRIPGEGVRGRAVARFIAADGRIVDTELVQ